MLMSASVQITAIITVNLNKLGISFINITVGVKTTILSLVMKGTNTFVRIMALKTATTINSEA